MYYVSLCKLCAIVIKFVVCSWFRSDFGVFALLLKLTLKKSWGEMGCLGDVTEVMTQFHQKFTILLLKLVQELKLVKFADLS